MAGITLTDKRATSVWGEESQVITEVPSKKGVDGKLSGGHWPAKMISISHEVLSCLEGLKEPGMH